MRTVVFIGLRAIFLWVGGVLTRLPQKLHGLFPFARPLLLIALFTALSVLFFLDVWPTVAAHDSGFGAGAASVLLALVSIALEVMLLRVADENDTYGLAISVCGDPP